ncbi:hypothetical protein T310_3000 [Rasamsonia emersonii CBS 393.64]|uniref:Uncharacterized protein n=1 Tax=Rasamsonia emersonii (strain ATCC 16479 / CBS 393.64 / IMI 116815) TaxID=1408163 RepID=A0A0F4YXI5_RASE3|nr:hypothetical protein T310_3000 [Rasamsonia emersonii CBS 393.64]KKA22949.1 hypothetical protein T310_3000 [Rasamsonia emersonii CBS 393.64]
MSGHYQRPFPPDRQGSTSANVFICRFQGSTGSPLSPTPSNVPVSFKTNVNRTKTKRWVEAKSYSYDGGDWGGDDDYEEETPPVPAPPAGRRDDSRSQSSSAPRSGDRSLSRDRLGGNDRRNEAPSQLSSDKPADAPRESVDSSAAKPPTFVRPADIYKRMQEEREKEQQNREQDALSPGDTTSAPSQAGPSVSLPELKRMSGFGSDFLSGTNQSSQETQPAENAAAGQEQGLHHNPSLGFRSVVNQAFDVPETPSSTVDSVVRSNSDSTSVISPITSNRILDNEKTPTITEEPAEMAPAAFQPGYRRDLTVPAPGNGPDKVPAVSTAENLPQAELAETSTVTPSQSQDSLDANQAQRESDPDNGTTHAPSPEPTKAAHESVPSEPQSQQGSSTGTIPEILPSMSTEASPQDLESDRLRKEIIRSLSPESPETKGSSTQAPQAEHLEPRPRYDSTYLPTEYDSYWNEEQDITPTSPLHPKPPASSKEPLTLTINPKPSNEAASTERADDADVSDSQNPQLKKRFSWEESDDSEEDILEDPSQPSEPVPPFQTSEKESQSEEKAAAPNPEDAGALSVPSNQVEKEKEKETVTSQPEPSHNQQLSQVSGQPGSEPKLPGFRQILEIKSQEKRIQTFKETREQFAVIDTGLANWIRSTADALPEHADLVQRDGHLPAGATRPVPSRAKFPKFSSLGNLSLATLDEAAGAGHARRPSGAPLSGMINMQNVESKGKDLLHSAGVLGGKAGGAARGFFAKGKSKLRGSGGVDKGSLSIFGHRRSLQLDDVPKISNLDREKPSGEPSGEPSDKPSDEPSGNSSGKLSPQRLSVKSGGVPPRLPSFRFHEKQSFSQSFIDTAAFSTNNAVPPRAYSAQGFYDQEARRKSLLPVSEEPSLWTRSETPSIDSSLTRRMMQSEGVTENTGSSLKNQPVADLYSAERDQDSWRPSNQGLSGENRSDFPKSQLDISTGRDSPRLSLPRLPALDLNFSETPGIRDSALNAESSPDSIIHLTDCEFDDPPRNNRTWKRNADSNYGTSRPVSPENLRVSPLPEGRDRRLSSASQVSAISEEMDAAAATKSNAPSVSQISAISAEVINAINGGLDGDTYRSEPEEADDKKHNGSEVANVDKALSTTKETSEQQNGEQQNGDNQPPRFSFESEGNRPVVDIPVHVLEEFTRAGEDAPDEPPPPFPEPEADYLEDKKEETEEAPPYESTAPSQTTHSDASAGLGISAAQHPPASQPPQDPPVRQPDKPLPTRQNGPTWRPIPPKSHSHTSSAPSPGKPSGKPAVNVRRYYAVLNQQAQQQPRQEQRREQVSQGQDRQQNRAQAEAQASSSRDAGHFPGHEHRRGSSVPETTATPNSFRGTLSRPDTDSQGSADSMIANAATSRLDLRAEPSPLNQHEKSSPSSSQQLKNKIMKIGKLPRMSVSGGNAASAEGKKMSSLISGFSKSSPNGHHAKAESHSEGKRPVPQHNPPAGQPQHTPYAAPWNGQSQQPAPYYYGYNTVLERGPPVQQYKQTPPPVSNGSFAGQPPPPEGYYAPRPEYSPYDPSYIGGYYQQPPIPGPSVAPNPGFYYQAPPPAVPPSQFQYQYPVAAPHQPYTSPPSHGHSSPSMHSAHSPAGTFSPPLPQRDSSSPERGRSRAEELHMRSRSPRTYLGRREEQSSATTDYSDPAHRLGKFNAVPETPRIGDQERPWSITLPEDPDEGISFRRPSYQVLQQRARQAAADDDDDPRSRPPVPAKDVPAGGAPRSQAQASGSSGQTSSSANGNQLRSDANSRLPRRYEEGTVIDKTVTPVELPVPGDDSSEEIVMSSTAYPGQEWHPAGYEHWMPY